MLQFDRTVADGVLVYRLRGRLTMGSGAQAIHADLCSPRETAVPKVLIDCSDIESADSSGIGVLVLWRKSIRDMGGAITIVAPPDGVVGRVLKAVSLGTILNLADTAEEGLADLKSRRLDYADFQRALRAMAANNPPGDKSSIVDEARFLLSDFPAALGLVEETMVAVSSEVESLALRVAQQNRLASLLDPLLAALGGPADPLSGTAAIVSEPMASPFCFLVEAALRYHGVTANNAAGLDAMEGERLAEIVKETEASHLIVCLAPGATPSRVAQIAEMCKPLGERARAICYGPTLDVAALAPTESMSVCVECATLHKSL